MILSTDIQPYISGQAFSNALQIPYNQRFPEQTRTEFILQLCKNKKVLHLGCADHIPLIKSKIQNGQWLHGLLMKVAKECAGIDINKASIEYLKNELNIPNVYHADLTRELPSEILSTSWDIVIMGEILEHIDNPVFFLEQLKMRLKLIAGTLLITVPNSFNYLLVNDIKNSIEDINSDHRYHFTPYTLTKIMYQAGFKTVDIRFTNRIALPLRLKIVNRLVRLLGLQLNFKATYFATMVALTDF
jgi:2-polyprenyl-3-methyl-5-hydroxy-6-metoxy-1,4-benzoquinol methylase